MYPIGEMLGRSAHKTIESMAGRTIREWGANEERSAPHGFTRALLMLIESGRAQHATVPTCGGRIVKWPDMRATSLREASVPSSVNGPFTCVSMGKKGYS